jgi:hypothetical protein
MGVGKVKKAQTPAVPQVVKYDTIFSEEKWEEFVVGAGLGRLRLDRYYLGKDWGGPTSADCEKLFTNLFADAVLAGAIVLPGSYKPADFTFKANGQMLRGASSPFIGFHDAAVKLIFRGKHRVELPPAPGVDSVRSTGGFFYNLNDQEALSRAFSNSRVKMLIERIAKNVYVLFSYSAPVVLEYAGGSEEWYSGGCLHRDDGPAVLCPDGYRAWYKKGGHHRVGAPAIERADGTKTWSRNGRTHRVGGPAHIRGDGTESWWVDGVLHRVGGPAVEHPNGKREWYQNGFRHRVDGPAVENVDGSGEWHFEGSESSEEGVKDAVASGHSMWRPGTSVRERALRMG